MKHPSHHPGHCGAVQRLRVQSDLPHVVDPKGVGARRVDSISRRRIRLHIGEVAASKEPVLMDTMLGSCVTVCMFDPTLRAGGMNHILLPKCRLGDMSPRCGIHAMELLINEIMKLGGDRRRFVAKAFGGANVIAGMKVLVGDGNAKFVREFLATERIPLVAERLGGTHAVHVYFKTDTGKVTVHTVDGTALPKILDSERLSSKPIPREESFEGDITLF